jgi:hypothetical protein
MAIPSRPLLANDAYQVIALTPGEARMLQLADGSWVFVVGIQQPVAIGSGEIMPPSVPTWGTIMVTAPNVGSTGINVDSPLIEGFDPDEMMNLKFEPTRGMVQVPGIHVISPLLADAIGSDDVVEFVTQRIPDIRH